MEQYIHITLRYDLAIAKVNLNEIVYRLRELRDPLMLRILEQILMGYDSLLSERLSQTGIYPSKARKGFGRHIRKGGRISARSIFATIVSAVHPCISRAFSVVVAPAFDRFHGDGPPGSRQVWLCW